MGDNSQLFSDNTTHTHARHTHTHTHICKTHSLTHTHARHTNAQTHMQATLIIADKTSDNLKKLMRSSK